MTKKEIVPEMPVRILKVGTCSTLSGRSVLTYHLGCNAASEAYAESCKTAVRASSTPIGYRYH